MTENFDTQPVHIPITEQIDLHTFRPSEAHLLVQDYLDACMEKGFSQVRIIHGKGSGMLKKRVRQALARNRHVAAYSDAPPQAGGWGATIVTLTPR